MPKFSQDVIVKNAQGLHARPAAMFVQTASRYSANVTVLRGDEKVNGKSIMGLLTLGVQPGTQITVEVDGEDAEELIQELVALLIKEAIE